MEPADTNVLADAQRIADGLPPKEDDLKAPTHDASDIDLTDAEAAADRVAEHWTNAARSLILACALLVGSLNSFADVREKLETFLSRLVARRVLSENDVLARLKANGKLSMLQKIGRHADTLLQPSFLPYLPAHYSLIYQICLTIEAGGRDRTQLELAAHPDATRDDIVKIRAALTSPEVGSARTPVMPIVDGSTAQLFALDLDAKELHPFSNEYPEIDTLQRCLRHPEAADDAGLVARVPTRLFLSQRVGHPAGQARQGPQCNPDRRCRWHHFVSTRRLGERVASDGTRGGRCCKLETQLGRAKCPNIIGRDAFRGPEWI
jgi:hypothetical protein